MCLLCYVKGCREPSCPLRAQCKLVGDWVAAQAAAALRSHGLRLRLRVQLRTIDNRCCYTLHEQQPDQMITCEVRCKRFVGPHGRKVEGRGTTGGIASAYRTGHSGSTRVRATRCSATAKQHHNRLMLRCRTETDTPRNIIEKVRTLFGSQQALDVVQGTIMQMATLAIRAAVTVTGSAG